jgi:hypothetical protein
MTMNIGYTLSRQKNVGNVCRSRKLGEAEERFVSFLIWVRRVLRRVITVYVTLFFLLFFTKQKLGLGLALDHRSGLGSGDRCPALRSERPARPQRWSEVGR